MEGEDRIGVVKTRSTRPYDARNRGQPRGRYIKLSKDQEKDLQIFLQSTHSVEDAWDLMRSKHPSIPWNLKQFRMRYRHMCIKDEAKSEQESFSSILDNIQAIVDKLQNDLQDIVVALAQTREYEKQSASMSAAREYEKQSAPMSADKEQMSADEAIFADDMLTADDMVTTIFSAAP